MNQKKTDTRTCDQKHTPAFLLRFRDRDDGLPKIQVTVCEECIDLPFFVKLQGVTQRESMSPA